MTFWCRSCATPFAVHCLSIDHVQARLATAWEPVVLGFAFVVAAGEDVRAFQRFDDARQAVAVSGFDQCRLVEQVQAVIARQLPIASAVEYLGVRRHVIDIGKAAAAMAIDEVENAGEDLPVFGIPAANPAQPFAIEQTAVGEGGSRLPREQAVGDRHLTRQRDHGEPISHASGLGVVLHKAGAHAGEVFEQSCAVVTREQLLDERWSEVAMVVMSQLAANTPGSPHTDEPINCAKDLPLELSPTR